MCWASDSPPVLLCILKKAALIDSPKQALLMISAAWRFVFLASLHQASLRGSGNPVLGGVVHMHKKCVAKIVIMHRIVMQKASVMEGEKECRLQREAILLASKAASQSQHLSHLQKYVTD